MLKISCIAIVVYCVICSGTCLDIPEGFSPRPLLPDVLYSCCSQEPYVSHRDLPVTYCYFGTPKKLLNSWQTVTVIINLNADLYTLYEGKDVDEIWSQFNDVHKVSWFSKQRNVGRPRVDLDPFNTTCLGIKTVEDYTIKLQVEGLNHTRVALFFFSIVMFFIAPILANSTLFYYLMGMVFGVLTSLLFLTYLIISILPLKRPGVLGLGVLAGGATLGLYFNKIYATIAMILTTYKIIVMGYVVVSALISLLICYRYAPLANTRSRNILMWTFQGLSLLSIGYTSSVEEITFLTYVFVFLVYNKSLIRWFYNLLKFSVCYPFSSRTPQKQFMTMEEYEIQGQVETEKELMKLRNFCDGPYRGLWERTMRSPLRLSNFIDGSPHVSDREKQRFIDEYLEDQNMLTDDSDDD